MKSGRECGAEVIENCGHDCSNPVISLAKAGHFSDLETRNVKLPLCLHSHPPLRPALFSWGSLNVRVVLVPLDSKLTFFTHVHTEGCLEFRQNKNTFFYSVLKLLAHLMHLYVSAAGRGQS